MTDIRESAFGKNDLRGIYGEDITEELFYFVGKAFIKYISKHYTKEAKDIYLAVAKDARNHSDSLVDSLVKGVTSTGANVINLGLVPTPIAYYAEACGIKSKEFKDIEICGSLMVTASHNPSEYNGLKLTCNKASLTEEEIKELKELTLKEPQTRLLTNNHGICRNFDIIPQYIEDMLQNFAKIGKNIKVVVDSANATAGVVAPKLYRELGCEVVELFSEPDGNFPNHHPNPSDEKTLDAIKAKVIEEKADLGIAFDGDSDRIGVIDSQGRSLTGDKLLLIYALDVIKTLKPRNEIPVVISEVKCSQVLYDTINESGGKAIMYKTGHGYIKSKMKEERAVLAGEMSGHMFFKDRYYGFDDAIYAGCRIIEIIAKEKQHNENFKIEQLLTPFDKVFCSKEDRYPCANELKKAVLDKLKEKTNCSEKLFESEIRDIITLDGLRIVFEGGGFALIRQSNTEPVFTLRFEACTKDLALSYRGTMMKLLEECIEMVKK